MSAGCVDLPGAPQGGRCWRQSSIVSSFLIGELLLGKLGETLVVQGNAPHNGPRCFVRHLVGNRAGFFCTKAPMPRTALVRVPSSARGSPPRPRPTAIRWS
jgi:hypothetical protein